MVSALLAWSGACKRPPAPDPTPEPVTVTPPELEVAWPMAQGGPGRTGWRDVPAIEHTPRVRWQAPVGVQGPWHSPVIAGDLVFVGSAGERAGQPDPGDGVIALGLDDGARRWFVPTGSDALGVVWWRGRVLAASADGVVRALRWRDGAELWRQELGEPLRAWPLALDEDGLVVFGGERGRVAALDAATGQVRWSRRLEAAVGGLASDGERAFVTTHAGRVLALALDDGQTSWALDHAQEQLGVGEQVDSSPVRLRAAPTVSGQGLVVTFEVEGTPAPLRAPPIFGVDPGSGRLLWEGSAWGAPLGTRWHGLRTSVVAHDQELTIFDAPGAIYYGLRPGGEGKLRTVSLAGPRHKEQTASPVQAGEAVYVPREDGALYAYTEYAGLTHWRLYLGRRARLGDYPEANRRDAVGATPVAAPAVGAPLQSTPALGPGGELIVGSAEGVLYRLDAPGSD